MELPPLGSVGGAALPGREWLQPAERLSLFLRLRQFTTHAHRGFPDAPYPDVRGGGAFLIRRAAVWAGLLLLGGCKLTEVAVNAGARTVVLQSVLNTTRNDQFVVLEYAYNGDTTGRLGADRLIPFGRPQVPILHALVT